MTNHSITKLSDKPSSAYQKETFPLDELVGTWNNVFEATKLIEKVCIETEQKTIYITVFGKGQTTPINWGRKQGQLYYDSVDSNKVIGFVVNYDVEFMENFICFNIAEGLLIGQLYCKFKDNSKRQDYFGREFFIKKEG